MSAADVYRRLVAGELTMCQAPGCANTFAPGAGKAGRKFCGEKTCPRRARVLATHHRAAINALRAELRDISEPPLAAVSARVRELGEALKRADASDDDLRVGAVRLGAAAALTAATVDALGRRGLSSQARGAGSSRVVGSGKVVPSPAELDELGKDVARAALGAAG